MDLLNPDHANKWKKTKKKKPSIKICEKKKNRFSEKGETKIGSAQEKKLKSDILGLH